MDDADFDMINNLMHTPIEPVSAEQIARNNAAVVVAVDAWRAAHAGPDAANAIDVGLAAAAPSARTTRRCRRPGRRSSGPLAWWRCNGASPNSHRAGDEAL